MRFQLRTNHREEFVNITRQVEEFVTGSGVADGAVLVFCPHTTAAITINENADPDVVRDLVAGLAEIAPNDSRWRHREGNSDGHLKTSLVGPSVLVPVQDGRLQLGTWQGIYFAEFDGPRTRSVDLTMLPGVR